MARKIMDFTRSREPDPSTLNIGSRLLFLKMGWLALKGLLQQLISFYLTGFRTMKLGRTLWAIILIKLLIMFGVLKLFFFPDYLQKNFASDLERADHVAASLTLLPTPEEQRRIP